MRFHFEEVFGDEVLYLFIATHNQPEHRRLYAPDRKYALIARVTSKNGVSARHIDTVQPVRTRSRQCRHAQRDKLTVGAQPLNSPLNGLRVEVVNQATLHLLALFRCQLQVIQHFIHQQLPFTIGVTGVNNFAGFMQKALNDVELFGHRGARLQLPLFRDNRQIDQTPASITTVVGIRLRLFKQVTNTPGHHLSISAFDKTIAFAMRLRQHIGDSTRQTWFFGNKQPHRVNESQPWRDRHELPLTHQWR